MGAWAEGPFDNDDAADFCGDLQELTDPDEAYVELDRALSVHAADGYIESPEMNAGVAAASIVALLAGANVPGSPYAPPQEWLDAMRPAATPARRAAATRTLDRAFEPADNEWFELWDEAESVDEVRQALAPYVTALKS